MENQVVGKVLGHAYDCLDCAHCTVSGGTVRMSGYAKQQKREQPKFKY